MNMRISLLNKIKYPLGILAVAGTLSTAIPAQTRSAENLPKITQSLSDTFELTSSGRLTDSLLLRNAPSAEITIKGEKKLATLVVDIKNNLLYRYNQAGQAIEAFKMACGKSTTPTPTGISVITKIHDYPYLTCAPGTKRRKSPKDYGPKLLELFVVNPQNGTTFDNGVYIHGTRKPEAIGKKWTHGCVRVHNKDILYLAPLVKPGQYVHFIK